MRLSANLKWSLAFVGLVLVGSAAAQNNPAPTGDANVTDTLRRLNADRAASRGQGDTKPVTLDLRQEASLSPAEAKALADATLKEMREKQRIIAQNMTDSTFAACAGQASQDASSALADAEAFGANIATKGNYTKLREKAAAFNAALNSMKSCPRKGTNPSDGTTLSLDVAKGQAPDDKQDPFDIINVSGVVLPPSCTSCVR